MKFICIHICHIYIHAYIYRLICMDMQLNSISADIIGFNVLDAPPVYIYVYIYVSCVYIHIYIKKMDR
jgi:hypothetical protein